MIRFLDHIRVLLTPQDKRTLVLLVLMMTFSALLELAGFGILLPVAAVFLKPEIMEHTVVQAVLRMLGITSRECFVTAGVLALGGLFTLKTLFAFWVVREQARFIYGKQRELAVRLYRNYLGSPLEFSSTRSVSEWNEMLSLVEHLCHFVLMPLMTVLTDVLLVMVLTAVLLYFIPAVTLGGGGFMLVTGLLIAGAMKRLNATYGKSLTGLTVALARQRWDGLGNYKYLKLCGASGREADRYGEEYRGRTRVERGLYLFGQAPRLLLEWAAMLSVLAIFCIMVLRHWAPADILLQFSLLIAAMARMLPAFSRIHYGVTQIRQNGYVFEKLYQDLTGCPAETTADADGIPATLDSTLELRGLTFQYAADGPPVIRDLSLTVRACESIALVGKTGCGKSTLSDLVMGLRKPAAGDILADGRSIYRHLASWRGMIGYVPQSIALMCDTVRNNVALGVPPEDVRDDQVRKVLAMAQLLDEVEAMPDGLNTMIGENGSRLSGGQRQRLAIARALYRDPRLLILDEATSALDNETEAAFVRAIEGLQGKLTMIVIAHRLSTVENCDRVIRLDQE